MTILIMSVGNGDASFVIHRIRILKTGEWSLLDDCILCNEILREEENEKKNIYLHIFENNFGLQESNLQKCKNFFRKIRLNFFNNFVNKSRTKLC